MEALCEHVESLDEPGEIRTRRRYAGARIGERVKIGDERGEGGMPFPVALDEPWAAVLLPGPGLEVVAFTENRLGVEAPGADAFRSAPGPRRLVVRAFPCVDHLALGGIERVRVQKCSPNGGDLLVAHDFDGRNPLARSPLLRGAPTAFEYPVIVPRPHPLDIADGRLEPRSRARHRVEVAGNATLLPEPRAGGTEHPASVRPPLAMSGRLLLRGVRAPPAKPRPAPPV